MTTPDPDTGQPPERPPFHMLVDQCDRIVEWHEHLRMDTPGDEMLRLDAIAAARDALDQCREVLTRLDDARAVPAPSPGADDDVRERDAIARALGPLIGGDDGAGWNDDDLIPVPREWVRRAYRLAAAGFLRTPTDPAAAFRAGFAAGHDWSQAPTTRDGYDTAVQAAWERHTRQAMLR